MTLDDHSSQHPMRLLAHLTPATLAAVTRSLVIAQPLRNTRDLFELSREARFGSFDAVLLETPQHEQIASDAASHDAILHATMRGVQVPILLLAHASVTSLRWFARASQLFTVEAVLLREDGTLDGVLHALERLRGARLPRRVFGELSTRAGPLPPNAEFIVRDLFAQPNAYKNLERAIAPLGTSSARINDDLKRNGLAALHILRRIARVTHAYGILGTHTVSPKQILRKIGVGSIDTLTRETSLLAGVTPFRLHTALSEEDLMSIALRAAFPFGPNRYELILRLMLRKRC